MKKLILASTSFRRQELITWLGLPVEIVAPDFDESAVKFSDFTNVNEYVKTLSLGKVLSVYDLHPDSIILSADTIVYLEGEVFGKPRNLDQAREVLKRLFGNTHQVYTAFSIADTATGQVETKVEISMVTFRNVTEKELEQYIQTGESMGKAGSYSIQGGAGKFVDQIEGSWTNVKGLPLLAIADELKKFGLQPTTDVSAMIQKNLGVLS